MTAGPVSDTQKWRSSRDSYIVHEYDDTFLLYFKPSGESHFLNFLSYGVVDTVSDQALTLQELQSELCSRFDFSETELPLDLIRKTISDLDDAALIEPFGDLPAETKTDD